MPYKNLSKITMTKIKSQSGLVLFFALMALAVMSIAAAALINSVDTNGIVSGNLAYRQSALSTSAVAIERVTQEMAAIANSSAGRHNINKAYFANCSHFDATSGGICNGKALTTTTWNDDNSRLVPTLTDGNDEINDGIDRQNNTIRYVVERMCNYTDAELLSLTAISKTLDPNGDDNFSQRCLMAATAGDDPNSKNGGNKGLVPKGVVRVDNPLYRVTLRISGPKNSVTYIQAFYSN